MGCDLRRSLPEEALPPLPPLPVALSLPSLASLFPTQGPMELSGKGLRFLFLSSLEKLTPIVIIQLEPPLTLKKPWAFPGHALSTP